MDNVLQKKKKKSPDRTEINDQETYTVTKVSQ